jgi:hypothetical protein
MARIEVSRDQRGSNILLRLSNWENACSGVPRVI